MNDNASMADRLARVERRQEILAWAIKEAILWRLRTPKGNPCIDGQYHDRLLSRAWHRLAEEFGDTDGYSGWISRDGYEKDVLAEAVSDD